MLSDLITAVQQLHNAGLYSNVVELCTIATNFTSESSEELPINNNHQWELQVCHGDSLLELKEWRRAEIVFREALQTRKHYMKVKQMESGGGVEVGCVNSEVDIKYKMHQCYVAMGQPNQAINILQSIISKNRTAKVSMALGRLYHQNGMERPAIAAYREVVRECPLAMEAIRLLLSLNVKPKEIQDLTQDGLVGISDPSQLDWFGGWLAGQSALYSRDYEVSAREFRGLEEKGCVRGSVGVLVDLGLAHHWAGDIEQAMVVLSRAASVAPHNMRGMDSLAALYAQTGKTRELESLATRLMGISEEQPQSWVAMGHFCHLIKKSPKAVYFAHKACLLDTRNVEALLLKGQVLLDLKKLGDALNHFREALQLAPHRFEAHRGMVDCYLGLSRQREAVTVATGACKHLSNSPRSLTLFATVLLKEPLSCARAKSLLEKAASTGHLPAVYLLVELLDREGATQRAVDLLSGQLVHSSTATLHCKLGDCLVRLGGQEERAVEHYSRALSLDPKNEGAIQGLQKMEANTDGMETSYDINDMEEVGSVGRGSPPAGELEDSETEAVWSDGDLNLVASGT